MLPGAFDVFDFLSVYPPCDLGGQMLLPGSPLQPQPATSEQTERRIYAIDRSSLEGASPRWHSDPIRRCSATVEVLTYM
jgi:hypothetical protein